MNHSKMLGKAVRACPGGRHCSCNPAPGKATREARRLAKRRERQAVRQDLSNI